MIKLFTDDNDFEQLKICVEKDIGVIKETVNEKDYSWYYNIMNNCENTLKDRIAITEKSLNAFFYSPSRFEINSENTKGVLYKESNFPVILNMNLEMQVILKDSFLLFCLSEKYDFKFIDTKIDVFSKNITNYLNQPKNLHYILQDVDKEDFKNYREALVLLKKVRSNCYNHLRYNKIDDFMTQYYGKIYYKNLKTFIHDLREKTDLLVLNDYEELAESNIEILKQYNKSYTLNIEQKNE